MIVEFYVVAKHQQQQLRQKHDRSAGIVMNFAIHYNFYLICL